MKSLLSPSFMSLCSFEIYTVCIYFDWNSHCLSSDFYFVIGNPGPVTTDVCYFVAMVAQKAS